MFFANEPKHALGRRFHRGRLGHDQPPRLSDRPRRALRRRVRGRARASCRCRPAAFPTPSAEIRARLGDMPLLLAGMIGSNRGWVEAPYVPCPAGLDDLVARPGLGRSERRRDRARRRRTRRPAAPTSCAARRCRLLGAVAAGTDPRRLPGLPSRHAQQMGRGRRRPDRRVPHGDDRRDVQPAQGAQHPRRSARPPRPSPATPFRAGVRRGLDADALTAELFSVRARVLLGKARARGRRVLHQRAADRQPTSASACAIGRRGRDRRHGPARADRALRRRHRRGRAPGASSSTASNASSPASRTSRSGSHDAAEHFDRYLDAMPAGRDHPRRHARRGRGDRRGDLRGRHPDHRSAAQFARSAGQHPAARRQPRRPRADRRRHGARRRRRSREVQARRRAADRLAQHQRRRDRARPSPPGWSRAPAISRRPKPSPRSTPARTR